MSKIRWTLAGAIVITLAWAACGGDDNASSSSGGGAGNSTGGNAGGGVTTGGGASTGGMNAGGGNVVTPCGLCGPGELCDTTLGCVDCLTNMECMDTADPICVLGKCEECADNGDCGMNEACSPTDHQCVPVCVDDQDCQNGNENICDTTIGACVECLMDNDCPNDPVCNTALGKCGECQVDNDCAANKPVCDTTKADCEECVLTSDCSDAELCVDNECAPPCASDMDCGGDTPVCDLANSGVCVECLGDGDCPDNDKPACGSALQCVECLIDDDCGSAGSPLCSAEGKCEACLVNSDCAPNEECKGNDCQMP